MIRRLTPLLALVAAAACSSGNPASPGAPPTSVNQSGASCTEVTLVDGQTVLTAEQTATGALCRPGQNAAGITTRTCKDGTKLSSTGGVAWWFDGKPIHAGSLPSEVAGAC